MPEQIDILSLPGNFMDDGFVGPVAPPGTLTAVEIAAQCRALQVKLGEDYGVCAYVSAEAKPKAVVQVTHAVCSSLDEDFIASDFRAAFTQAHEWVAAKSK